jgi:hypothetical protein
MQIGGTICTKNLFFQGYMVTLHDVQICTNTLFKC